VRDDEVPGWWRGLGNGARLLRLEPPAATSSKITWTL
jgi:hypothetical protein